MRFPQSLSLAALGLLAISFVNAEPIAIVHGMNGEEIQVSANYIASFDSDATPEPAFTLDDNVSKKLISLRRRGGDDGACAAYYTVEAGDTCHEIIQDYDLSLKEFYNLNPSINRYCTNLKVGKKYCVKEGSSSGASQSGDCTATHKITSSDTCITISEKYGISLNDFYDWNPTVNRGSCDNLEDGKLYCVAHSAVEDSEEEQEEEAAQAAATKQVQKSQVQATAVTKKVTSLSAKTSGKATPKKTDEEEEEAPKKETRKKIQSGSAFTYYWIAQPQDYSGGSKVSIKTCSGSTIATVSQDYADALVMEGTGTVGNKIVNLGDCSCKNYACFEVINRGSNPYGITAYGSSLRPYVTVAANDFPRGTKIYVPQLDGWTLPGSNKKHNGCLVIEDQSWSFESNHIDFYVYDMSAYEKLDQQHRITKVDIYDGGNCKLINYM